MRLREPLLLPFAAVAAGLVCARFAPIPPAHALGASASVAVLAATAWQIRSRRLARASALIALALLATATPGASPRDRFPRLTVPDLQTAIFAGCVTDPALLAADREQFTLELAPSARARVSLFSKSGDFPSLPYGTLLEITGKARQTHNFQNPGAFDNVHFLARQHIFWNLSANAADLRITGSGCGNPLLAAIFALRSAALERLDRLYSADDYSNGMMQAVLLGVTAKLDHLWTVDYRSTGTFHALVISGSHVAVLAAVLLFFLRICAVPGGLAVAATIAAAWLYAGVTGWQAPVLRSAAGMSLYGIARCFYREGRILNILAAVALLFVLADPEQLFDPSFQLSFLAVAIIGAFVVPALNATSAPLARGLSDLHDLAPDPRLPPRAAQFRVELRLLAETARLVLHIPERLALAALALAARLCLYFWEIFVTSFFIQLGLALPMVIYFHRLSASGLSANALVVPILSAVVPLGFLAIALNSLPLAHLCASLLGLSRAAVAYHVRWEPDWRIPAPPLWLAALFAAALLCAALRTIPPRARAAAWLAAALSLAAIVAHPFAPQLNPGKFELSMLDVGQGDSLFAAFPDGTLMLIDAGGIPTFNRLRKSGLDIGEDVVSPWLWSRSIKHLDIVAMTHAHEDHMGGMSAVLRNFHPRELWTGAIPVQSPEWRELSATANQLHIRIRPLRQAPPVPFAGASLEVLAPLPGYLPLDKPQNDDSLVLRIRYGLTSFLLTGDMERRTETELARAGLLLHDDVLKVAHHGSRTSSTPLFLGLERPAFALISAGFDNSYGHPAPATLAALADRNIPAFRTDRQGLLTVVSDGRRIRLDTAAPPR